MIREKNSQETRILSAATDSSKYHRVSYIAAVMGVPKCCTFMMVIVVFVNEAQSAQPFPVSVLGQTPCQYDDTCDIPNSYCSPQTRTCECKSGHTYSNDRRSCIKLPQRVSIGDRCERPEDCAFTEEASRCADNVCRRCSDGTEREFAECTETVGGCAYHEVDGVCFRFRKLGEPCELSEECWIYPGSEKTRECSAAMCQCAEGYNLMSGPLSPGQIDQCLKKSSATSFSISVSMVVFLMFFLVTYLN